MVNLYVENYLSGNLISNLDSRTGRSRVRAMNGRMLWFAGPGDVVVLSRSLDHTYVKYACGLLGVDPGDFDVVVPPPGVLGTDVLTRDRLCRPEFLRRLSRMPAVRAGLRRVVAYVTDETILRMAGSLGAEDAVPGRDVVAQGGVDLLNSKGFFRATGRSAGVPIAEGVVMRDVQEAAYQAGELLRRTGHVIVKRNFHTGGYGNVVLSRSAATVPIGALETVEVRDSAQVEPALRRLWPFLSASGSQPVVIERYHPGSTTLAGELELTERDVRWRTHVEMRMNPRIEGFVWRPFGTLGADESYRARAVELARKVHDFGYRGILNVDSIVTPGGEVLITEFDGRHGGLTHLHSLFTRLLSASYVHDRHIVVVNLPCEDVSAAIAALHAEGLGFDARARRGVVLASAGTGDGGPVECCVIGGSESEVLSMEDRLRQVFPARGNGGETP
ncbi:peptide ligase PGM1-related protein [Symbioplanes lichenis]|uniref:preATP grasp domain-containing protein n=1 Tax=Symbioplanes lichenis TaxID=1629072 RepID=UPI00273A07B4|nr:peptide ligase PGM1-related protein [Actinoplanes lichenis]